MADLTDTIVEEIIQALRENPNGLNRASLMNRTSACADGDLSRALGNVRDTVIKIGNGKSTVYMLAEVTPSYGDTHEPVEPERQDTVGYVSDSSSETKAKYEPTFVEPTETFEKASDLFRKPAASQTTSQLAKLADSAPACANLDQESYVGLVAWVMYESRGHLLATTILMKRIHEYDQSFTRTSLYSALSHLERYGWVSRSGKGAGVCKGWKHNNTHPFDGKFSYTKRDVKSEPVERTKTVVEAAPVACLAPAVLPVEDMLLMRANTIHAALGALTETVELLIADLQKAKSLNQPKYCSNVVS